MNTKQQILDYLKENEITITNKQDYFWELTHELEGLCIEFSLEGRQTDSDYWIQAGYYSPTLKKTIIWDYDYTQIFEDNEDFAETLANTNEEIKDFEKRIKFEEDRPADPQS